MIKTYEFHGKSPGRTLLLLGGIHGDEPCGGIALDNLVRALDRREIVLNSGRLICVPVCNERAAALNARYSEENLNRVIKIHAAPDTYEKRVANELASLFDEADYILDLHSQPVDGVPFCFADQETEECLAFAAATGAGHIVLGWPELYESGDDSSTGDYAIARGKVAATLECGGHQNPSAPKVAYIAALNALKFLGMIDGAVSTGDMEIIRMKTKVLYDGGRLAKDWKTFDAFRAGDILAFDSDGLEIKSDSDGYIILPNPNATPGEEWFYTGRYEV